MTAPARQWLEALRGSADRLSVQAGRDRILVALLGALVFLPGLGRRDLWNPDEARYAEVAREMRLADSYLVPHLNGEVYSEKPPLHFWAICGASVLWGGLDETAVRLPSALAAVGTVLVVFVLGDWLFNRRAAWLSAAGLGTCLKVLLQGRFGQIDMLLTFLVSLAMLFWVRGRWRGRPSSFPLFFLFCGVATLAKGPAGFLPPLLAILAFLGLERDRRGLRQLRPELGLLIWAAVVLAWLVPAVLVEGREYLDTLVFKQNLTRYLEPWHHHRPWYYYLMVLPVDFFPWLFFLPAAALGARRCRAGGARQGVRFAACWALVTLVFFTLSPAKRTVYILTMYPALGLVVGAGLDRLAAGAPPSRRWLSWPALGLAGILGVGAVALPRLAAGRPEVLPLDPLLPLEAALLLGLVAAALAAGGWAAAKGRITAFAGWVSAGMAFLGLSLALFVLPGIDVINSARPLARRLVELAPEAEPYAIYPRLDAPFLFYTGRFSVPLADEAELRAFASRRERVWLLIERDRLALLETPLPMIEVARDEDLVHGYLLMTTVPWPEEQPPIADEEGANDAVRLRESGAES